MTIEKKNPHLLKLSQVQSAGLLDIVSDLVWSLSTDGQRLIYINPAAAKLYDRPQSDLLENNGDWIASIHADDQPQLKENLSNIAETKRFSQKFRIVQPDGTEFWLDGFFQLILDENRCPCLIGGTAKDITKRMRAERKLEESQAIYHSLVESLPINVFRKDRSGKIVFANQKYCDDLGLSLDELVGLDDADLFEPDLVAKYVKDDAWVLQTGLPFHDIEIHPKGDETIYVEVLKAAVTDKQGRRIGIQGMFWDVTDRKKSEEALRQAKELAEAASRAKSDFLANVSHEIRTPMNGIMGMTDLLMSSVSDKKEREYLELIQTSADSLLTLINDILDFSKIEAGKVQLESQRFQLRDSLGDTLRSLAFRAHAKDLELIAEFSPETPDEVIGDVARLRQVIVNLVSNAIKFTSDGFVKLVVDLANDEGEDTARIRFQVIDSGIGIPPEKQQRVFDEFEQADTSTTREYGGTGLGLAIASKIVNLMGGKLELESELGSGSNFFFTAEFHIDSTSQVSAPDLLVGQSVLVACRSPEMLTSLASVLRRWKIRTTETSTAEQAFDRLNELAAAHDPFRLLITDVELPDYSGTTLASWIRKENKISNTPIIFLQKTNSIDNDRNRSELGIDHQLLKPVKEKDLFESIAIVLGLLSPTTNESTSGVKIQSSRTKPLNVLVAEDNLVNQKLVAALLEKVGHAVVVAINGRRAVELFSEQSFDLILMDVQMPEMDGFEATYEIRKFEGDTGQRIPIIALTAHASESDRKRCLAAGMDEYIAKPIRAADLYALIDSQTGHHSNVDSDGTPQPPAPERAVNWEHAFETVGGDRPLLTELITVFLDDHETLINNIRQAIQTENEKELRLSAHSIKGALTHLGGREAVPLAGKLEELASSGSFEGTEAIFKEFQQALDGVIEEMKRFLAGS